MWPLQPAQKTQLQPHFGTWVNSLCHHCITTTPRPYRFLSLKFLHPPCAVLLVDLLKCTYIYMYMYMYMHMYMYMCMSMYMHLYIYMYIVHTRVSEKHMCIYIYIHGIRRIGLSYRLLSEPPRPTLSADILRQMWLTMLKRYSTQRASHMALAGGQHGGKMRPQVFQWRRRFAAPAIHRPLRFFFAYPELSLDHQFAKTRCWNFDYGRYKYTGLRQDVQLRDPEMNL